MSDILNVYLKKSSCNMENCPFGIDVECSDCNKKMLEEHNKQIRADAIEEMKSLIFEFDDYCDSRRCSECWMNIDNDSCLSQWIKSKFEQLKEQSK